MPAIPVVGGEGSAVSSEQRERKLRRARCAKAPVLCSLGIVSKLELRVRQRAR